MTRYCLILAKEKNGGIGLKNQLPWHIKSELKHFKETTNDSTVIVGRRTFENLPPLPGRTVKVMTRQPLHGEISDIEAFIQDCKEDIVYIIGGAKTYQSWLPYITDMIITTIHEKFEHDTSVEDIMPNFDHYVKTFYNQMKSVECRNNDEPPYTIRYYKKKAGGYT